MGIVGYLAYGQGLDKVRGVGALLGSVLRARQGDGHDSGRGAVLLARLVLARGGHQRRAHRALAGRPSHHHDSRVSLLSAPVHQEQGYLPCFGLVFLFNSKQSLRNSRSLPMILVRVCVISTLVLIAVVVPYFLPLVSIVTDISVVFSVYIFPAIFYWKLRTNWRKNGCFMSILQVRFREETRDIVLTSMAIQVYWSHVNHLVRFVGVCVRSPNRNPGAH